MDQQNTNPQDPQATTPAAPAQPEAQAPVPPAPAAETPAQPAPTPDAATQTAPTPVQPEAAQQPAAPAPADPVPSVAPATPAPQPTPDAQPVPAATPLQATAPVQTPATQGTMQQVGGVPGGTVLPAPKKGISIWLVMSFIVLLFAGIGGYYFYTMDKNQSAPQVSRLAYPTKAVASPTIAVSLTPSPSSTQSATGGSVSGTLCYPGSAIPAGTITAKNMSTNKLYTQAYIGTAAGGGTKYSFPLPAGTYRLKFTPTQYPTAVGYYTDYSSCVGNPTAAGCSGQKVRPLLNATVSANLSAQNVNLCDYYYPTNTPPQF